MTSSLLPVLPSQEGFGRLGSRGGTDQAMQQELRRESLSESDRAHKPEDSPEPSEQRSAESRALFCLFVFLDVHCSRKQVPPPEPGMPTAPHITEQAQAARRQAPAGSKVHRVRHFHRSQRFVAGLWRRADLDGSSNLAVLAVRRCIYSPAVKTGSV